MNTRVKIKYKYSQNALSENMYVVALLATYAIYLD